MTGLLYQVWTMEQAGISSKDAVVIYSVGTACCLLGARLMYAAGRIPGAGAGSLWYYLRYGGISFYGGMLGSVLSVWISSRILKRDFRRMIDHIILSFPLFHAVARLGCFFSGCCYGIPWDKGIAMAEMPDVPRVPVQLLESLCCFLIFAGLLIIDRIRGTEEYNLEIYLVSYAVCRYFLEFLRGDFSRGIWQDGLSTAQHVSVLILAAVGVSVLSRYRAIPRGETGK